MVEPTNPFRFPSEFSGADIGMQKELLKGHSLRAQAKFIVGWGVVMGSKEFGILLPVADS